MEYLAEKHQTVVGRLSKEVYTYMPHLPDLDEVFCTEPLSMEFGYLSPDRSNRTQLLDYVAFEQTKFCQDALKQFGWIDAAVLKFTPNTMLDWHIDDKRRCALNFLLNESTDCFTFIREQSDRWTFNVTEIKYPLRRPILIDTTNQHTHLNYSNTHTRYVLTVSFGNQPDKASYAEVREWLLNYNCDTYK